MIRSNALIVSHVCALAVARDGALKSRPAKPTSTRKMTMKRFTIRTHHSPEMLAQLCRSHRVHQTCICGVFNCPMGEGVKCGDVMPWMWKELLEEEKDDANDQA